MGRRARHIPVMEIFGPTIQGEGAMIGKKTMFIRTGGCDYRCSWCDSKFTWDGSEKATMMEPMDIWQKLCEIGSVAQSIRNFNHVTISGGNPALIGEAMGDFIRFLKDQEITVGTETQGSKWQDWMWDIDDLTISPKPPSSDMHTDLYILDTLIGNLTSQGNVAAGKVSLKVVVFDAVDFRYAKTLHLRYPHVPFYVSVGNLDPSEPGQIAGRLLTKLDELFAMVINDPAMNNVRPLPQLHTLVWDNKRSV